MGIGEDTDTHNRSFRPVGYVRYRAYVAGGDGRGSLVFEPKIGSAQTHSHEYAKFQNHEP